MTVLVIGLGQTHTGGHRFMVGEDKLEIRSTKLETSSKHEVQMLRIRTALQGQGRAARDDLRVSSLDSGLFGLASRFGLVGANDYSPLRYSRFRCVGDRAAQKRSCPLATPEG
jgi:hypothetical protein